MTPNYTHIRLTKDITFTSDVTISRKVDIITGSYEISGSDGITMTFEYLGYGDEYGVSIYGGNNIYAGNGTTLPDGTANVNIDVVNYGRILGSAEFHKKVTNDGSMASLHIFSGTITGNGSNLSTVTVWLDGNGYIFTKNNVPKGWSLDGTYANKAYKKVKRGQSLEKSGITALPVLTSGDNDFKGWFKENGDAFNDNDYKESIRNIGGKDGDPDDEITLTAQWTVNENPSEYQLTFDPNTPGTTTEGVTYKVTGTMNPQKFVLGETWGLNENQFVCNYSYTEGAPDKDWPTTAKFFGWNTEPNGTGKTYGDKEAFTYDGTVTTLYAQWQIIEKNVSPANTSSKYTLTYYVDNSKAEGVERINDPVSYENSPKSLPYIDADGNVAALDNDKNFANIPAGKTHIGWRLFGYPDSPLFQPGDKITLFAKQIDLYAVWGCKVTFNSGVDITEQLVEADTCVTRPADPTQANSRFLGWYKDDGTKFNFGTPINGDITLTAKWEAVSSSTGSTGSGGGSCVSIVKQPQDTTAGAGERTKLTVEAVGQDLNYQWYVNRNDGKGFVACKNSCAPTYTLKTKAEQDGYRFYCRVYNDCGSVCTNIVTLTVNRTTLPKTGDRALTGLCLIMAVCCMGGAAVCLRGRKKKA